MNYYQYSERKTVSVDEFINYARKIEDYKIPTFKQSLIHLWNSLQRNRILRKRIPNLEQAIKYLERHEILSVEKYDKPSKWEWERENKFSNSI